MKNKAESQKSETCSLLNDLENESDFDEIITSSIINDNNNQSNKTKNDCSSIQQETSKTHHATATISTDFSKLLTRLNIAIGNKRHFLMLRNRAWSWMMFKRKLLIGFAGLMLLILYMNSYFHMRSDERIPVLHYSHVPGMKEASEVHLRGIMAAKVTAKIVKKPKLKDIKEPSRVLEPEEATIVPSQPSTINATIHTFASSAYLNSTNNTNIDRNDTIYNTTSDTNDTQHTSNEHLKSNQILNSDNFTLFPITPPPPPPGYLVWSENCKMPNHDPYLPEVMDLFKRQKYEPCSTLKPLTRVKFVAETQRYALIIDKDSLELYTKTGVVNCCYQSIERTGVGKTADEKVSLTKCINFKNGTQLEPTIDNILVNCTSKNKRVYLNGHAMLPARPEIRERLNEWQSKANETRGNATSVLMIGIDSISRINLIRAMPKTAQYLYDNEWFEMSGYNKIDDNTFPNLMAILAGYSNKNTKIKCPPTKLHALDNCTFIWKTFREHGYVTAYAEDEASINTFNYLKVGFAEPPVDYYLRPFLLSAEQNLPIKKKSHLSLCVGMQKSADIVYDYALELAKRYKHEPYFGLFWTNTFSHNAISDCSAMDDHMVEYLEKFAKQGILNNSIVIFLSDHGLRFGPTRKTYSGHLEERLPFMFIWLPPHLKHSHPEFVNALNMNKNRLTNPYDVHMTLKHVLSMSGRVTEPKNLATAEGCERCQTLLSPVPHNRSCSDVAIEDHWCTCIPYQSVSKNNKIVQKLARNSVDYINNFVSSLRDGYFTKLCHTLHLSGVENAYRSKLPGGDSKKSNDSLEIYRINFNTKPNHGQFEATLRYNVVSGEFKVTGEISRLDSYATDAHCIADGAVKKYCSCRNKVF